MLRTAVLAAVATCVVGVRKNRLVNDHNEELDMERVEAGSALAERWCTLEDHTLSCEEGSVIQIVKAQYNRQRSKECNPPVSNASVDCNVTITDSVAAACNRMRECTVPVSLHSSCPEYPFSYIRVRFECAAGVSERNRPEAWNFEQRPDEDKQPMIVEDSRPIEDWRPIEEPKEPTTTLPSLAALSTTIPAVSTAARRYSSFNVWIKTSDEWWSGTDDTIYIKLMGHGGVTSWQRLDYPLQNDFERGSLQVYPVTSSAPIATTTVCLMKKRVGFWDDSWRPHMVKVYEDESWSPPPTMIGWVSGWGVLKDENPLCKPLHLI